jgi:hypothetical protein
LRQVTQTTTTAVPLGVRHWTSVSKLINNINEHKISRL